jgi:uncharacterized RDD family membrane protein YckC
MEGDPELNPYAAPTSEADVAPPSEPWEDEYRLAERGTRLGAHVLDGVAYLVAAAPGFLMAFGDLAKTGDDMSVQGQIGMLLCALGFLVMAGYQWYLVSTIGQSIGKRALRIKIVRINGEPLGFVHGVILRTWVLWLLGSIPYLGSCVGTVDVLMIFSEDRRCLHDRIAGTMVIVA